jgi:hypothetical protein
MERAGWELCGGVDAEECFLNHTEHGIHPILMVRMGRVRGPVELLDGPVTGVGTYTRVLTQHDLKAQEMEHGQAMAGLHEVLVEEGGSMRRVEVPGIADAREEVANGISREKYEARKHSDFFTPLDDPMGEGHCRSCHHVCAYEGCNTMGRGAGQFWRACQEPTCGHWMGCPGC